jgi:holo-[acyl-carrier protein] synthase
MKAGIDSVEVKRFKKIKKLDKFLTKYFTDYEINYILSKNKKRYETIAGLFSAKEAFLKALKIGIGAGISLKFVEIKHDNNFAPYININKKINKLEKEHNINEVTLSITHTKKTATAICIIT